MLKVHGRKDFLIELALDESALFAGDRDDLYEALGNLMENAAKWCRGQVRVSGDCSPRQDGTRSLTLVVEDDGPGFPSSDRERVMQRGVRADEDTPGHGLGLAMVQDMARVYGGEVELGDSALGGARVQLRLPGA